MIQVNLAGAEKRQDLRVAPKAAKAPKRKRAGSLNTLSLVHVMIIVVAAIMGYLWYSSLSAQSAGLTERISGLQQRERQLEAVIKQDQIYESRKMDLENRIQVIEDLRKNQISPVVVLDALDDAIDRTHYVWLSSLSQKDATFTMAGMGTSVDALSDFVSSLKSTGYFRNINLSRFDDSRGNYTFNMTCEFAPPSSQRTLEKGAN